MIYKKIFIDDLLDFLADQIVKVSENSSDIFIDNLAEVERVNETTLDWINPSKANKQQIAESSKARVLLVDESVTPIDGKVLIYVKNPKVALAEVGNHFFVEKPKPGIHPTAVIDSEAKLGKDVSIGPCSIIGKTVIREDRKSVV